MKPGNRFLPLLLVASLLSGCAAEGGSLTVGEDSGTMVPDAPLVVYYSFSGEVEQMAREISDMTGGQGVRLDTVTVYPEDDRVRTERIRQEQDQGVLPELEWNIEDLERYDTVYIGTCLWNGELPPAVKAFLTKTELEGKTVIPFGAAGTADRKETEKMENLVKEAAPESDVAKGFLQKSGEPADRAGTISWLAQIGQVIPIRIEAGETELTGVLFHNKISEELAERLPLEVSLYEPADFAKAFNLEKALAEPDSRTRMLELGGLAYWPEGAAVALFFRDNVERTVVPVYTLGKVLDDVRIFEEYEGGIKITRLSIN